MDDLFGVTELAKKVEEEHAIETAQARSSAEKAEPHTVTERDENPVITEKAV